MTAPRATPGAGAYLWLGFAVLCWAGNFVIGRGLRFDAPPVAITFWRWTLAFVVLVPFTAAHILGKWSVVRRSWRILGLLALLATVFQHIPIYWGLRDTTATNASLLNSTSPILIAVLSVLLLRQRMSALAVFGSLVSLAGVLVIVGRGELETLRALQLNRGDIWILGATLSWAAYTVCLRWRPPELGGLDLLTLIAGISAVALAPLWLLEIAAGRVMAPTLASIAGIGYVGVVASVLAYIAWNHGVGEVGPARAGPFMYLMLVFTPILSIAFLGEQLQPFHFAGAGLIIVGIYLATVRGKPRFAA